jgi:hypothetical protein
MLVVAWLPYIATRCVQNPLTHPGCHVYPGAAVADGQHSAADSHEHSHPMARAQGDHRQQSPHRTCCDLTGECSVRIAVGAAQLDAPTLLAAVPVAPVMVMPAATDSPHCDIVLVAHSPPTYLRNATLLL